MCAKLMDMTLIFTVALAIRQNEEQRQKMRKAGIL